MNVIWIFLNKTRKTKFISPTYNDYKKGFQKISEDIGIGVEYEIKKNPKNYLEYSKDKSGTFVNSGI